MSTPAKQGGMEPTDWGRAAAYEAMRRRYGPRERGVRAVALLYGAWAAIAAPGAALIGYLFWTEPEIDSPRLLAVLLSAIFVFAVGLVGAAAWHLRQLSIWGQLFGAMVAGFSLLGFPLGTVVGSVVLWTLLGERGRFVFSEEYKEACDATPNLEFRVPKLITWLVVAFVSFNYVGIALALVAIAFDRDGAGTIVAAEPKEPPEHGELSEWTPLPTVDEQRSTVVFFKPGSGLHLAGRDPGQVEAWKQPIDPLVEQPLQRKCTRPAERDDADRERHRRCDSRKADCRILTKQCAEEGLCDMKWKRCINSVNLDPDCCTQDER